MVATIPSWVAMAINQDQLDLNPPGGSTLKRDPVRTSSEYLKAHDEALAAARAALNGTTDEQLMTSWRLLVGGTSSWNRHATS